jgi:ribose-phosphate pyrophosphokinase
LTVTILSLPGNESLAVRLATLLAGSVAGATFRSFPDGETLLRVLTSLEGETVVLAGTLDRPDEKTVPLLIAADAARDLGARRVLLAAPYLAYMRQDARFHPGEAVTAKTYARLLSGTVDGLVTVDPHLHRLGGLDEIYSIPTVVVHAAPAIAEWVRTNVPNPIVVGPDAESEQWVADVADRLNVPYLIGLKERRGDRDVTVTIPGLEDVGSRTPVLFDDIVSTGATMIEALGCLRENGVHDVVCVAVHGILAGGADLALADAGAGQIVTANTVLHASNEIDVTGLIADGVRQLLAALD